MEYVSCNLCGSARTRLVFPNTIPDRKQPQGMEASGSLRRESVGRLRAAGPRIRVRFFPSPGDGTGTRRRNGGSEFSTLDS